eukprot:6475850-Amphidinium_carterae.3
MSPQEILPGTADGRSPDPTDSAGNYHVSGGLPGQSGHFLTTSADLSSHIDTITFGTGSPAEPCEPPDCVYVVSSEEASYVPQRL